MHTKSSEAKNKLSNNYPKTDELSELQKVSQNKKKKNRQIEKKNKSESERERGGGEEETWMNEIRDELRLSVFSFREEI